MTYDTGFEPSIPPDLPPRRMSLPLSPVRATYALIVLNIFFFLSRYLLGDVIYWIGALAPSLVVMDKEWWRLVTAGFLHADILHIAFNLYALHGLGALVERFFGMRRFLWVYGVALFGTGVLVTVLSPLQTMTVGASGAIMGLLGALLVYYWRYRDLLVGGRNYLNELIKMAVINVGIGLLPGISLWGHFGGLLAGVMVGWALCPRYEYDDFSFSLLRLPLDGRAWGRMVLILGGWLTLLALGVWLRG